MTREEAVRKLKCITITNDYTNKDVMSAHGFVDGLVALGMLKLDEPEDMALKFAQAVCANIPEGYLGPNPRGLMMALETSGLKIVEK